MFSNREREGRDMSRCNYYGKAFFAYQKPIFEPAPCRRGVALNAARTYGIIYNHEQG